MKRRDNFWMVLVLIVSACGNQSETITSLHQVEDKLILWRDNHYDPEVKDSISTIVLDEAFFNTISDGERAAIGYVATFTGNECWWKSDTANQGRSNLECKLLSALDLGGQCSGEHLEFLRHWFRNDTTALKEFEDCPTIPYTATVQTTFSEIRMTLHSDTIKIRSLISGINLREDHSWDQEELHIFVIIQDELKLIKKTNTEQ